MNIQKNQSVKGMVDILPDAADKHKLPPISMWHFLETAIRGLMYSYNYDEIRFPILEHTSLFERSLGAVTDIVEKEMYTFVDGDTSVTLRPEGTASCVRACLENGLLRNQQLQKLWYIGPMFRHEQPQYGRYRQFYQFGAEVFGLSTPNIDVEQIAMLATLWRKLGIHAATTLEINTIGGSAAREIFKKDLVEYFSKYKNQLDQDSIRRLTTNPLRILDSKNPTMQELINSAPVLTNYLNKEDSEHFAEVCEKLTQLQIPYRVNPRLIRGLDYYNCTVYEWVTDKLGAQAAICAGGRYDTLTEQLGGSKTPAIGFAMGMERVLLLMQALDIQTSKLLDGYLVCIGAGALQQSLLFAEQLRTACSWFSLAISYDSSNFKNQLNKADKSGAKLALIIGDDELANETVTIKFLREQREQETVLFKDLKTWLGGYYGRLSN